MNIETQLNLLADLQAQEESIRLRYEERRQTIITDEILAQLAELDADMTAELSPLDGEIEYLTNAIKEKVITVKASVKGSFLQAVYSKPRVSWDTKGLDGYAVAHPEITTFRTTGAPSVSIRGVK